MFQAFLGPESYANALTRPDSVHLAVIQDAAPEVASGASRAHGLELDLEGVTTCRLNTQILLLALKNGQLWQLNLVVKNSIVEELKVIAFHSPQLMQAA